MGLTLALPLVIALKYRILSQSENLFLSWQWRHYLHQKNWFSIKDAWKVTDSQSHGSP
ncbi:MAG: hypothetical protein IPI39_19150 [Candidatus Obscuribacter sp.]|nr:hypothetical protein [Candidatus Obscuribacter sp.]